MKDLIAKLKSEANVALGAIWLHIDAQAARIAELEAQIAAKPADTDKLREAILEIHVILPSGYDEREVSAFKAGAKATSDAALKVLASTALQAPVGDGIANDTEAVQAILDGNRLQAPVREVPEESPMEIRKGFMCANCLHVYDSVAPTQCDCLPKVQAYIECEIRIPALPAAPVQPEGDNA